MSLTTAEVVNVQRSYPRLKLTEKDGKKYLAGEFCFVAFYDVGKDELTLNPPESTATSNYYISDSFQIEIEFLTEYPASFPLVRETGGRIKAIVEKYKIVDIRDLHVNKNQNEAVCLCPKPAESLRYPNGVDLLHFMNNLVVPFFFGLSYFEKHQKWPWSEYSHGEMGIFEFFAECQDRKDNALAQGCYDALGEKYKKLLQLGKDIKGHWLCICGSGEKFRNCHGMALKGIWVLKQWLKQRNNK